AIDGVNDGEAAATAAAAAPGPGRAESTVVDIAVACVAAVGSAAEADLARHTGGPAVPAIAVEPAAPAADPVADRGRSERAVPTVSLVAQQGAVDQVERALVDHRAAEAGRPAAAAGDRAAAAAVAPLGETAAQRQVLEGQAAGRADVEQTEVEHLLPRI